MHQHTYPTCEHRTCTSRAASATTAKAGRTSRTHPTHRPTPRPARLAELHTSTALADLTHFEADLEVGLEADIDRPCAGHHPPDARPLGTPTWCTSCTEKIQRALSGPMGIADLLALATGREDGRLLEASASPGPRVTTSPEPPSPSTAHDNIDEIHRWASDCATYLATYLGHPPAPDDPVEAMRLPDLTSALSYLARFSRPALAGPFAVDFGQSILRVHRRLRRAAGEHDQRRRLRVPCPACQALALIREDGGIGTRRHPGDLEQVEVECTFCGAAWTEAGFQAALERAS